MPQDELFETDEIDVVMVVNELRRELGMRGSVYPRQVAQGRMTQKDANYRIACLRKAIELLT